MPQWKKAGDHFLRFRMPREEYERFRDHCHAHGMTVGAMVRHLIRVIMREESKINNERKPSVQRAAEGNASPEVGQEAREAEEGRSG